MDQNLEASQKARQKKTMHKVAEEHVVGYITVGNRKKKRSEIKKVVVCKSFKWRPERKKNEEKM